jgi:hypothetical protein
MRVKRISFNNSDCYLIYLTQQERMDCEIKKKIDYYRSQTQNVAIFVSGSNDIKQILYKIKEESL